MVDVTGNWKDGQHFRPGKAPVHGLTASAVLPRYAAVVERCVRHVRMRESSRCLRQRQARLSTLRTAPSQRNERNAIRAAIACADRQHLHQAVATKADNEQRSSRAVSVTA